MEGSILMVFLKCAAFILWYNNAHVPVLSLVYISMAIVMNVNNLLFAAWWS